MAGISNVAIRITAETASAVRDINKVEAALGDQVTAGQKAANGLKKAAVPAAIAFAAVGTAIVGATKAAAEDADAAAHLEGALKRTTGATDAQVKASEDYIEALSNSTGVADDELRPALEKLAGATGSAEEGQKLLTKAVDLAAAANVPLAKATKAIVDAEKGRLGGLGKLVPGIDKATIASKDSKKALEEMTKLTGGAAADSAKTYAGQQKIMTNQISEAQEEIGAAFLPVLKLLVPIIRRLTKLITENTDVFTYLAVAVMAIAGAVLAANAAMKIYHATTLIVKAATALWTGVNWLLNASILANPIGIAVVAIVALVAAIVIAYKKSETFRDIVDSLWDVIKSGLKLYFAPLILAFEGLKLAIDPAKTALDTIKTALSGGFATTAINTVKEVIGKVKTAFGDAKDAIRAVYDWVGHLDWIFSTLWAALKLAITVYLLPFRVAWEALQKAIETVWDWIKDVKSALTGGFLTDKLANLETAFTDIKAAVKAIYDWIVDIKNATFELLIKALGFLKDAFAGVLGVVKKLASYTLGGLLNAIQRVIDLINKIPKPDLGFLGKLDPRSVVSSATASVTGSARAVPGGRTSATGGAGTLTINVYGALDAEGTARAVKRLLDSHERRQGRST